MDIQPRDFQKCSCLSIILAKRTACLCLKSYRVVTALPAELSGNEVSAVGGGGIRRVEANLAKVAGKSSALNLPALKPLLHFCRLCSVFDADTHFAESHVFVYCLNLLKMRFTSCDLPAIGGERLLGWGRLWGTEAGDLLKGSAAAVPRQALSDGG